MRTLIAATHGCERRRPARAAGFSLIELLVVIGIISALGAMLMTAAGSSRQMARDAFCRNNLRQLGIAVTLYTGASDGYFPPQGYWQQYPTRYWWGANAKPPRFSEGFLAPYIGEAGADGSVYQCPEQEPGSYRPEGAAGALTTTYGYNGYYLTPPAAPGWASSIGHRPWQCIQDLPDSSQVFLFADAMLDWGKGRLTNTCFLDPPFIYSRGAWVPNKNPTTCFRHAGRANVCFVDGHVDSINSSDGTLTSKKFRIGYVGRSNAPHYVPDWEEWAQGK